MYCLQLGGSNLVGEFQVDCLQQSVVSCVKIIEYPKPQK